MSKAEDGNITEHLDDATPSRRATLAAIAGCVAAASVRQAAAATNTQHTPLFRDVIQAYQHWVATCNLWGELLPSDPDFDRLSKVSRVASVRYHDVFTGSEHAGAPSLVGLGEVYYLWRVRCWSNEAGPDQMIDEFEARALGRIIQQLTGVTMPVGCQ
jgi:hypothetical protein